MAVLYAILTVTAWGIWLVPSQRVKFNGQQVRAFYVTMANLLVSGMVAAGQGLGSLPSGSFWLPFSGGLVWALGAWTAFAATEKIGLVRAYGVWAPLNIIVSIGMGALFFHEFVSLTPQALGILAGAVCLIIAGVLLIIFSKGGQADSAAPRGAAMGWGAAVAAGFLWAAYYIPIKIAQTSMWVAAFPMGCGMFAGCLGLVLLSGQSLRLGSAQAYLRTACTGALWSCGNYGMLLLVRTLGSGRGYTISQLALVANALCGVYFLKDPPPGSRAARLALAGCALATIGAITLGQAK